MAGLHKGRVCCAFCKGGGRETIWRTGVFWIILGGRGRFVAAFFRGTGGAIVRVWDG